MSQKICLFFIFYIFFTVSPTTDLCPSVEEFEKNNEGFMGKDYEEYKEQKKHEKNLEDEDDEEDREPNYLDYLADTSIHISSGNLGKAYELHKKKDVIVRFLKTNNDGIRSEFINEIEKLRFLCGHKEEKYNTIAECHSLFIAGFKGCIFYENRIYMFQERMFSNLFNKTLRLAYRALPAYERVRIMLDIIDRFIELHEKKIVHSDIKPENIMIKSSGFSDIRIIDFRMSKTEGEDFVGGSHGYVPPEVYKDGDESSRLSYKNDIFALGMTLGLLEGDFGAAHICLTIRGSKNKSKIEECKEEIAKGLGDSFSTDKKLSFLLSVMMTALEFNMDFRFDTMKDFADAIILALKESNQYSKNIKEILNRSNDGFRSYWRSNYESLQTPSQQRLKQIELHQEYLKKQEELKKQQELERLRKEKNNQTSWFGRVFTCFNNDKPKKQIPPSQPTTNKKMNQPKKLHLII